MRKQYFIDLRLYGTSTVETKILYYEGDVGVYPLFISLKEKGDKPFTIPEGAVVSLTLSPQDGEAYPRMAEIVNRENGVVLYEMDAADLALTGTTKATLTVIEGENRLTWPSFRYLVKKHDGLEGGEAPEFLLPWKNAIEARLSELDGRLGALEANGGGEDIEPDLGYEVFLVRKSPALRWS